MDWPRNPGIARAQSINQDNPGIARAQSINQDNPGIARAQSINQDNPGIARAQSINQDNPATLLVQGSRPPPCPSPMKSSTESDKWSIPVSNHQAINLVAKITT